MGLRRGGYFIPSQSFRSRRRGGWEGEAEKGELATRWGRRLSQMLPAFSESSGAPGDPQRGLLQCKVRGGKVREGAIKGERYREREDLIPS